MSRVIKLRNGKTGNNAFHSNSRYAQKIEVDTKDTFREEGGQWREWLPQDDRSDRKDHEDYRMFRRVRGGVRFLEE